MHSGGNRHGYRLAWPAQAGPVKGGNRTGGEGEEGGRAETDHWALAWERNY